MSSGDPFGTFEFAGWERAAQTFEATWSNLTRQFVSPLLRAARVGRGTRLLDVACGPGHASAAATALGASVTGVDFSPNMIRVARQCHPGIDFVVGDAQALESPDASFDAVVMCFGLMHLPHPDRGLTEALRVLRPGGRLALSVWAGSKESAGARLVESAIEANADLDVPIPEGPDFYGFGRSFEDARATLERLGFRRGSVELETVKVDWCVPSVDFFHRAILEGGVRIAGLLAAQNEATLAKIRLALEEGMRGFAVDDGFVLPYAAYVFSAER